MVRSGNVASSPMAFSSAQHFDRFCLSRLVRIDYNRIKDLVQTFARTPGLSFAERRTAAQDFLRAASSTVAAEQAVLLPLLRRYPEDINQELVDHAFERRVGLLKALEALDAATPTAPDFDAKLERCWILLNAAYTEMDQRLLPALDRHCPWQKRERHGRRFYLYRLVLAPTRPHSWVPAEMAGGLIGAAINTAMAPMDWAKDLGRFGFAMPV
jgi:hypothetical protein